MDWVCLKSGRLKQSEEETRKLKPLVAHLSLDRKMLQVVIAKKW